jgi:hypothetical protein
LQDARVLSRRPEARGVLFALSGTEDAMLCGKRLLVALMACASIACGDPDEQDDMVEANATAELGVTHDFPAPAVPFVQPLYRELPPTGPLGGNIMFGGDASAAEPAATDPSSACVHR